MMCHSAHANLPRFLGSCRSKYSIFVRSDSLRQAFGRGADRKYPLSSILEPNCHTESPIGMAFIDRDAGDSISAKQE
jgi:hypothetical protein